MRGFLLNSIYLKRTCRCWRSAYCKKRIEKMYELINNMYGIISY
jgi:hypothetical protein